MPLVALQRSAENNGFPRLAIGVKCINLSRLKLAGSSSLLNTSFPKSNDTLDSSSPNLKSLPSALLNDISQFKIEGFAKKFFAKHKKGIFRKKVPLEEMLLWTKESIPAPLMQLKKDLHKEALRNFKLTQRVMGDRSMQKNENILEDIQEILKSGVLQGELRDETYCQVCKQLTKNPDRASFRKGWDLMSCLVVTFPPSKDFEAYLHRFLQDHINEPEDEIAQMALYCLSKLVIIARKGPRGKVPTIQEIERAIESPFKPSVFGESLLDIMAAQEKDYPTYKLPRIMTFLSDAILELNGCATEGIFRVPGDADAEKGIYDLKGITDASVPASLLKSWYNHDFNIIDSLIRLRDLSDPIIPHELYDFCIKNAEDGTKALTVIQHLPEFNLNVLQYLIHFLQIICDPKNEPVTRMSVNNIAMVFAPNILRCPSDNLQVILEQTKYEQAFVRTLIQHMKVDVVGKMK